MLKGPLLFFALVIGTIIGLQKAIQERALLRFLDEHPHPRWVPMAEYYVGRGLLLFNSLSEASTYFIRIPERYPQSPFADKAYFNYVLSLDEAGHFSRRVLAGYYERYLEMFPRGKFAPEARAKIEAYRREI